MQTFLLLCNTGLLMILVFAELYGIKLVTKRKEERELEGTILGKGLHYEDMPLKIGGRSVATKKAKTSTKRAKDGTARSAKVSQTHTAPKEQVVKVSLPAKKRS